MERLVTLADLEKYPELVSKGISLNQYFDFDVYESVYETPPVAQEINEPTPDINKPKTKKKSTKPTQKKTPTKQKAKRK